MTQDKHTATPKTLDLDAIHASSDKAGMPPSEFLEWGLYTLLETYDATTFKPGEAQDELRHARRLEGQIPEDIIPANPLAEFAADAGMHFGEVNELALLSAINIMNSCEFTNKQPREMLEEMRHRNGPLIPSFTAETTAVHPFMHRLFSGDLRAVHGPDFGDLCSKHVVGEHHFLESNLKQIFSYKGNYPWEEIIAQLDILESVIRYCPKLQNEAAAIRALVESERVLGDFCRAVNAC